MTSLQKNELGLFYSSKSFYVGEEIKGYAELKIPVGMEIQQVTLRFTGTEILTLKGKTHINLFYDQSMLLIGDGSKDHGKDWLGRKKVVIEKVNQGAHRYPFAISLPSLLPPTHESPEAKIKYVVEVVIDNGNPKVLNLSQAAIVNIGGSMWDLNFIGNNGNPFQTKESKTFMLTKGSFDINVHLDSRCYLPGDPIKVKLGLDNSTSKVFQKVSLSLVQKTELFVGGSLASEKTETLGTMSVGGLGANENKFPAHQIFIPTTTPETLQMSELNNKKKVGKLIRFSHALVFYAEVGGLFGSETTFMIPIYICRRPTKEEEIDDSLLPNKEPEYQQKTSFVPQFNPSDYEMPPQEEQQEGGLNSQMMNSNPYLEGQESSQSGQNLYPSFESNSNLQDIPLGFQINQQQQSDYQQGGYQQEYQQGGYQPQDYQPQDYQQESNIQYQLPEGIS